VFIWMEEFGEGTFRVKTQILESVNRCCANRPMRIIGREVEKGQIVSRTESNVVKRIKGKKNYWKR
jgi:hypothetical protein